MNPIIAYEDIEVDEWEFLKRRFIAEKKVFYLIIRTLLVITCFISIFVTVSLSFWFSKGQNNQWVRVFIIAFCGILVFIAIICLITYLVKLLPFQKDILKRKKIIERVKIKEKKYMDIDQSYHFYINSDQKYSIEVSESDFEKYNLDDEICIQYAAHTRVYLGYF